MDDTKTKGKILPKSNDTSNTDNTLNAAMLDLEDICLHVPETSFAISNDSENIYWHQRFNNIVTKISLALAEVKGPRYFHQHYRHDYRDDTVLLPVLEEPMAMLAHACEYALDESERKLSAVHDKDLVLAKRRLDKAIKNFLIEYDSSK